MLVGLPGRNAAADVAGRDVDLLDREERDLFGSLELLEHVSKRRLVDAWASRDAEASVLKHLVRRLPVEEVGEAVCTDQEDNLAPALAGPANGLVRVRGLLAVDVQARDLDARHVGEGSFGQAKPRFGIHERLLARGLPADRDDEPVEPEVVDRRAGEGKVAVVRRVERSPQQACHESSSTSSPTATSSPVFAPALRTAASSSACPGGRPTTR